MSASPDPAAAPEPRVGRGRVLGGVSAAWAAPLLALAIAGTLAWRHYASLGPEITLHLSSGEGLEAGRTPIRYRDIQIGVIESLDFSEDMGGVVAAAQMRESVAGRITADSRFWVVRPQIGLSGISGVETLLSGAYVEAELGSPDAPEQDDFAVLDQPPLTPPGAPGRRVTLTTEGGTSLAPGAPVFFKTFEVGRVETKTLSEDGARTLFEVFIEAPFDERLSASTRFWDRSGVSVSLGAGGVEIDIASLASVLQGGVSFDNFGLPEGEARESYRLYAGERAARDSLFAEDPAQQIRLTANFGESVRGLEIGAPVEYRGVRIGEVEDMLIQAQGASLDRLEIVATLLLQPGRLGLEDREPQEYLEFFQRSVARGLRARLASGNIVTGSLYVQLADVPNAASASLDLDAEPFPRLPTTPSALDEIQSTAQEALGRVAELPFEDLFARAVGVLANLEAVTASEALQTAPEQLAATLETARGVVAELRTLPYETLLTDASAIIRNLEAVTASEAIQQAPAQLAEMLETARSLIASLEEAGIAESAAAAADSAASMARAAEAATARLPELLGRLDATVAAAQQTISAYGAGSALNTEAVAALREVRQAARAVGTLAGTLERRPNSLILGR